jgi:hypothetical protein
MNPLGLNRDQIIAAFRKWEDTTVGSAMKRNLIYLDVEPYWKTSLNSANKSNLMLVTENGQHIGVLDTENLLEFLLIKSNLCLKFEKTHPDRIELVYSGEDYFSRLEQIIQNVNMKFIFNSIFLKMMPLDRAL